MNKVIRILIYNTIFITWLSIRFQIPIFKIYFREVNGNNILPFTRQNYSASVAFKDCGRVVWMWDY